MDISKRQIEKYWGDWILWRKVGHRVEAFIKARSIPRAMLDTIFFLDYFFGKMEAEQLEKDLAAEKRKRAGVK